MNILKLRAYYKGDIARGQTIVFLPKILDGEFFFVMRDNEDFRYGPDAIFCDEDWIFHQSTETKDITGYEIYESDLVEFEYGEGVCILPVAYFPEIAGFGVHIEGEGIRSIIDIPDIEVAGVDLPEKERADDNVYIPHKVVGISLTRDYNLLRAWMLHLEITADDLAEQSGIGKTTIEQMMETHNADSANLQNLAHYMGLHVQQLTDEE